ncbi:MAG: hydroxyacid dehydrogenase [Bdellovibrionaceae bacterium]|nr:hydroxyacid dehydrogenase [Pseudobdellovibrionaceae bacterium]
MISRHRLLITDRFDAQALAHLQAHPRLDVKVSATPLPTTDELLGTQALLIRSRTKITTELLAQAPDLQVIITSTSGFDHIDLQATTARKIDVMFTPDANSASAAELTWALVLACARRLPEAGRAIKAGDWARERLIGHELEGKTYGIIGLGRIGRKVARFAQAFGMTVLAYDPYCEDAHFQQAGATRSGLDELLRQADVVSLHVPLTPETRPLLHAAHLTLMSPHAILVNTSRGQAIDENALIEALQDRRLGAVGLDVFAREPLTRSSQLLAFPHVVLSPHLGATTMAAFTKSSREAAEKAIAYLERKEIRDRLPGDAPWLTRGFQKTRD